MMHMDIKIENQLKRKGKSTRQNLSSSSSSWKLNFVRREEKPITAKPKIEPKQDTITHGNQGKIDSSTT